MRARLPSLSLALLLLAPSASRANDSAAEIAAGGLVLKEERRVAMKRERLVITRGEETRPNGDGRTYQQPTWRVSVEYEFVNESAEPVVTQVAFPEPERSYSPAYGSPGPRWLRAWVDGKPVTVTRDVRATHAGRDVTARLQALGANPTYEQCGPRADQDCPELDAFKPAFQALGADRYAALVKEDLLVEETWPAWSVRTTWHWRQEFPPGRVVRIRHEYEPSPGFSQVGPGQATGTLPDRCHGAVVQAMLQRPPGRSSGPGDFILVDWVKYVLLTANNWKRPIGRFELVVEHLPGQLPAFCWDGPIERISPTVVRARAVDFVPTRDLVVYFTPAPE